MKESTVIRIGDKFKRDSLIYEVIGTRPGGVVELMIRSQTRFIDLKHRDVKLWERVSE